jgi:hypothetical protein
MLPAKSADLNPFTICNPYTHQGPSNHITFSQFSVVADRDPVLFLLLDPRWEKKSELGADMNIPDHFSEGLEKNFWVKK